MVSRYHQARASHAPLDETERLIRETIDYVLAADRLAQ